jgi:hypothetical protein
MRRNVSMPGSGNLPDFTRCSAGVESMVGNAYFHNFTLHQPVPGSNRSSVAFSRYQFCNHFMEYFRGECLQHPLSACRFCQLGDGHNNYIAIYASGTQLQHFLSVPGDGDLFYIKWCGCCQRLVCTTLLLNRSVPCIVSDADRTIDI